ncbi:MAG: phosphate ABC transporter permease [Spirulina sp. SIO3F2]|nr:phosphate ABC transporter permease [Spirulina sp. SIO3F2]
MLIPLTREKFEQLIPVVATYAQYSAVQGGVPEFLQRVIISVLGVVVVLIINVLFGGAVPGAELVMGIIMFFYWLWSPVWVASLRNSKYRRWRYSGFWRGRVLDVFISEDLIREDESFNRRGELVIVENRERRINVEIGDRSGFRTIVKAPLQKVHKLLAPGQIAECVVMSNQPDLSAIEAVSDLYVPSQNLWVGDYPCLRRDFFEAVSEELAQDSPRPQKTPRSRRAPPEPRYNPRLADRPPRRRPPRPRRRY